MMKWDGKREKEGKSHMKSDGPLRVRKTKDVVDADSVVFRQPNQKPHGNLTRAGFVPLVGLAVHPDDFSELPLGEVVVGSQFCKPAEVHLRPSFLLCFIGNRCLSILTNHGIIRAYSSRTATFDSCKETGIETAFSDGGRKVIGERIAIADELSRASEEVRGLAGMLSTMAESDEEKERSSVYVFISHFLESHSERLERVVETLERGGAEK